MNIKQFLLCCVGVAMMGSCTFGDTDCIYGGNLIAFVKDKETRAEDKGTLLYYPHEDVRNRSLWGAADSFTSDTLVRRLDIGSYDLLYLEKGVNQLIVPAGGTYQDVKVLSPTLQDGGKTYHLASQTYITRGYVPSVLIDTDEDTRVPIDVRPLVKEIRIHIEMKGGRRDLRRVRAVLDGVSDSKRVHSLELDPTYASLRFDLDEKVKDVSYVKTIYVLGINTAVTDWLHILTDLPEGEYHSTIDLTPIFEKAKEDVVEINLTVDLDKLLGIPEITIESWKSIQQEQGVLIPINNH